MFSHIEYGRGKEQTTFDYSFGSSLSQKNKRLFIDWNVTIENAFIIILNKKCRRCGFNPWLGKIPLSRKWQPAPVFLPKKFLGQRSLVGYSPWGCRVGHDCACCACSRAHTHIWSSIMLKKMNRIVWELVDDFLLFL